MRDGVDVYGGERTSQKGETAWASLYLKCTCVEDCEEIGMDKVESLWWDGINEYLRTQDENVQQYANKNCY